MFSTCSIYALFYSFKNSSRLLSLDDILYLLKVDNSFSFTLFIALKLVSSFTFTPVLYENPLFYKHASLVIKVRLPKFYLAVLDISTIN